MITHEEAQERIKRWGGNYSTTVVKRLDGASFCITQLTYMKDLPVGDVRKMPGWISPIRNTFIAETIIHELP